MRLLPWTLAGLCLLAAPRAAEAWTCSPTLDGRFTQVWQSRCIPYSISTQGSLLSTPERRRLVQQSFEVWASEMCSDLEFKDVGDSDQLDGFDPREPRTQQNVIASIEDPNELDSFQDPRLLALTLTHYSIASGEILDADIILNSVRFTFAEVDDVVQCRATSQVFDLRNTLVHEIGHFIGFDHTAVEGATMFASAEPCEIEKRDLLQDDRDALCTVYPAGLTTKTCVPPPSYTPSDGIDPQPFRDQCMRRPLTEADAGGCSCSAKPAGAPSMPLVFLLGLLLFLRRRR